MWVAAFLMIIGLSVYVYRMNKRIRDLERLSRAMSTHIFKLSERQFCQEFGYENYDEAIESLAGKIEFKKKPKPTHLRIVEKD